MSDFLCSKDCSNRNSFGYCNLTACNQIRWTDKLYLDSDGNIRDFYSNVVGHYDMNEIKEANNGDNDIRI